ncbi:MAG: DNRLRE domain-containing protein [Planctomycetota bacterium]
MRSLAAVLWGLSALLPAQSLQLLPVADATTDQSQPTVNFGTSAELAFGKNYTSTPTFQVWFMRGHVLFDLGPAQAVSRVPVRATFHWYQSHATPAGCLDVSLHRLLAPFAETTVTWQNQPAFDPLVVATACVGSNGGNGWKDFDVTALVQGWLDGTWPNFGFVVRDPSESPAGAARPGFGHSRENGNPALAPWLEIEFADRFGWGCSMRALFPMSDVAAGAPRLGGSFVLRTISVMQGSVVGVLFGTSNTTWSGGALPWSLAPIGIPYCNLYVSPDIAVTLPIVNTGSFDLTVPLPNQPGLVGASLFMQAVALPPQIGLEMGNGVGVVLRN